jgi:hypothetical protein
LFRRYKIWFLSFIKSMSAHDRPVCWIRQVLDLNQGEKGFGCESAPPNNFLIDKGHMISRDFKRFRLAALPAVSHGFSVGLR